MLDLMSQTNRMLIQLRRIKTNPELIRTILVSEINHCECPWKLRTDQEHRYFRHRRDILYKAATNWGYTLRRTEDGRVM